MTTNFWIFYSVVFVVIIIVGQIAAFKQHIPVAIIFTMISAAMLVAGFSKLINA